MSRSVRSLFLALAVLAGTLAGPVFAQTTAPATPAPTAATAAPATAAPSEYPWADALKNPCPYFNWGGDIRERVEYINNAITLNGNDIDRNKERDFLRNRVRLWGTATDNDHLEGYVRMTWESRYYFEPKHSDPVPAGGSGFFAQFYGGPVLFDNLYFKLKNLPIVDNPLSVTVGRQDIILGDGWLVLDGTPLDGSRTIYFDLAARAQWDFPKLNSNVQLIYVDNSNQADHWLPEISDFDENQVEQNERGAMVYWTSLFNGKIEANGKQNDRSTVSPYFIYKEESGDPSVHLFKNAGSMFGSHEDTGEIYTFGGRMEHYFTEHLKGRIEGAYQDGHLNGRPLSAGGALTRLTYMFNDALRNQIKLNGEYMSGDKNHTGVDGQFQPLWGRWPQFSELYVYTYAPETRIGEVTNLYRMGLGWEADPTKQLNLRFDYNAMFADSNVGVGAAPGFINPNGYFRGHLLTGVATYKFNRFLAGHLWGEVLFPGNYYGPAHRSTATFMRAEISMTF